MPRSVLPAVRIWLASATTTKRAPPPMASQPSSGWKMKIAARNNGVQGRSNTAKRTGDPMKLRTASRSWIVPGIGLSLSAALSSNARRTGGPVSISALVKILMPSTAAKILKIRKIRLSGKTVNKY